MEEKRIIQEILRGNASQFSYFVTTYQDMAYTLAYRICRNVQDAEDVVQDAFVKVFRNLHAFRLSSKFSTWFYRIVYNTALTHVQTGYYTNECADSDLLDTTWVDPDVSMLEQMDEAEKSQLVNRAVDELPHDYAVILTLFYLEEHSIKDVEQITGWSASNVKVKLHRARKLLAEKLQPMLNQ